MEEFKQKYPVSNKIRKQIEQACKSIPVVNLINSIIGLTVDPSDDALNTDILVRQRLCILLHTASCVKQYEEIMLHIIGKILELSKLNHGKELIHSSLKYADECGQKFGDKDSITASTRCLFSIFSRTRYEELLSEGKITQLWTDPSIA